MKFINPPDLAIALEYHQSLLDFKDKYVIFNNNSSIFKVNNIKVSSHNSISSTNMELSVNFSLTTVPKDSTKESSISFRITLTEEEIHNTLTNGSLVETVISAIKKKVTILTSQAIPILYEEKAKSKKA